VNDQPRPADEQGTDPSPPRPRASLRPTAIISGQQFAAVIRAARLAAGLRPPDLAATLGIAVSTLHARENGTRTLTVNEAIAWLEACGHGFIVAPSDWHREEVSY
jgi:ribosome-binding protein aMBF1 (putative translation factor)